MSRLSRTVPFLGAMAAGVWVVHLIARTLPSDASTFACAWRSFSMCFALLGVLFIASRIAAGTILGEGYFVIRPIEAEGHLHRRLGVGLYRTLLLHSPFALLNRRVTLHDRSTAALLRLDAETRRAEESHLFGFILTTALAVDVALRVDPRFLPWMLAWNVPLNLYPLLLQRLHRARIGAIRNRR